jgi:hypothetical protein
MSGIGASQIGETGIAAQLGAAVIYFPTLVANPMGRRIVESFPKQSSVSSGVPMYRASARTSSTTLSKSAPKLGARTGGLWMPTSRDPTIHRIADNALGLWPLLRRAVDTML